MARRNDEAARTPPRAAALMAAGLVLAILAVLMLEQSARWLLTSASRAGFVGDEFEIEHLRDQAGRGGFNYGGHIVSSGETVASSATIIVSLERLRELQAAGKIPGARVPVQYLPAGAPWVMLDAIVRFRVQAPDEFEANALGWTIVNVSMAAGAVWLIRRSVRLVSRTAGP